MMKFFRKHNKQMLAIFMALLLVVWLGGEALTSFLQADVDFGKQVQGTAYGETVRLNDMLPAFHETELLNDIGLRFWQAPWYLVIENLKVQNPQQYAGAVRPDLLTREEWYMLDTAARRASVHVPPEAVENFKAKIGLTPEVLNIIRQKNRKTMEEVDQALQSLLRVQEAAILAAQAVKVSEADINDLVRQTGEKARITAVVVDSKSFIDETYEPTAEEIQAQFDNYKNVTSRPGESGYQMPAAAQIEVIGIEAERLVSKQQVAEQEAYSYWKEHPDEFLKPATSQPATATATAPAVGDKPYTSFSEARLKVIEKLRKDKAKAEAQRIAREAIEKLQASWARAASTQPVETAPAATAPAMEGIADAYEKLAAELQEKYPGVAKNRRLELMTEQQLQQEAIGTATAMPNSDQQVASVRAAFMVPGLGPVSESSKSHPLYRALYETAPQPFISPEGNALVLRTIAVRSAQAPPGPEAVREQIVKDIRQARATEQAQQTAESLRDQAAQKGLEAALNTDEALKQKLGATALHKPEPFPHRMLFAFWGMPQLYPAGIQGLGRNAELINNIFAMAGKAATQPSKVTMVEEKEAQRFIVAELLEILPVTRADYERQRATSLQTLETQRRIEALGQWFDPQQIRARVNWQDAPSPQPAPDESDTTS